MGTWTRRHASLQRKRWGNENFKIHVAGPRPRDIVKLAKRSHVNKPIEPGRRCFLLLFCLWTTGIHQHRGTSLLPPRHEHIAGTHKPGSPQPVDHGGKTTPGIQDDQAAANETQPHLTQVLNRLRGVPSGGTPAPGWFGSSGCFAWCSSRRQESLQPARSPTLNSFPILYSTACRQ